MNICNPFSKEYHACADLLRTFKEKDDLVNGIAIPKTKTTEKIKAFVVAVFIVIASLIVAIPTFLLGGVALFRTLVGRLVYKGHVKFSDRLRYSANLNDEERKGHSYLNDSRRICTMNTSINNINYTYFYNYISPEFDREALYRNFLNNNALTKMSGGITVYEGSLKDGMYEKGKETHKNGDVYEGDFDASLPDGEGIYTCKNGFVYDCQWNKGLLERGKEILPNRTIREGSFAKGLLEGEGYLTLFGGERKKGTFTKGLFRVNKPV